MRWFPQCRWAQRLEGLKRMFSMDSTQPYSGWLGSTRGDFRVFPFSDPTLFQLGCSERAKSSRRLDVSRLQDIDGQTAVLTATLFYLFCLVVTFGWPIRSRWCSFIGKLPRPRRSEPGRIRAKQDWTIEKVKRHQSRGSQFYIFLI